MPRLAETTLSHLLTAVDERTPTPGGGAVLGVAAALAAGLTGMAGRYAGDLAEGAAAKDRLVARAGALRQRAVELAEEDAAAYGRYAAASRTNASADPRERRAAVRAATDAAAQVPLEAGRLALELAEAGRLLTVSGNPHLRSDARIVVLLSSAVARGAALLVEENLPAQADDPRRTEARRCANAAEAIASQTWREPEAAQGGTAR